MKATFLIKPIYLLLSITLLISCKSSKPYTEEMKSELKNMFKKDQAIQTWDSKRLEDKHYIDSMNIEVDNEIKRNCEIIKKYYKEYSFPGLKENGKETSMNFWLLVQHSDHDVIFQEQVLKSMKKELKHKNASPNNYAYLCDRVLKNKGEKQLYGSQVEWSTGAPLPYKLKYPEKVDEMRKKNGIRFIKNLSSLIFEEKLTKVVNGFNYLNLKIMKKISLKSFENSLSRSEMRNIMAGKKATPECTEACGSDSFCSGNTSCPCCNGGSCGA
jgi:hypothetical protein